MLFEFRPAPRECGLAMEGFYVWGGSVVKDNGMFHMFASRWPVGSGFPEGYRAHSEIVRAESPTPQGPYTYTETVITKRPGMYWDSQMSHNPYLVRYGNRFLLFYIGSRRANGTRRIGFASAEDITGPWRRIDEPLALTEDANNPAPLVEPDGSIKLAFRDRKLRMGIATAPSCEGPFTMEGLDLFPGLRLEDPCFYHQDGMYHIICEDNQGKLTGHERWGVHLVSEDGISGWRPGDPPVAYNHTVEWRDGDVTELERRERPQVITDDEGSITHLITSALYDGKSWCMVQEVVPR